MRKPVVALVVLSLMLAGGVSFSVLTQQQPLPQIPGIVAKDNTPNGCVDCHKEASGKLAKLSVLIKDWSTKGAPAELVALAQKAAPANVKLTGKHPDLSAQIAAQPLPDFCLGCHATGSKNFVPLNQMLHLFKFTNPDKNTFVTQYGGWCTNCHTLNKDTGVMGEKSGKEAK